jgi:hypothetical protein
VKEPALATFRRKNAIFEILRGEQKKTKAAMIGGLGLTLALGR